MNRKSAERKFILLKQKLNSGSLSQEKFEKKIEKLRIKSEDGFYWQPRLDGAWLKWDGQQWQETGETVPQQLPFLSRIWIMCQQRAVMMLFSMGFSWVLHTYIMVVLNQGFNPDNFWGRLVNTVGNMPSAMVIWSVLSMLIWSFVLTVQASVVHRSPLGTVTLQKPDVSSGLSSVKRRKGPSEGSKLKSETVELLTTSTK